VDEERRSDDQVLQDVVDTLLSDGRLVVGDLNVDVADGHVRLRGVVRTPEDRDLATAIVGRLKGVRSVLNDLHVGEPRVSSGEELIELVERTLAADPRLKDSAVAVRLRGAILHLEGSVPSEAARSWAEDDARNVPGVRAVVNELRVEPRPVTDEAVHGGPEPSERRREGR
jgi:hyperosmotically inducible protein